MSWNYRCLGSSFFLPLQYDNTVTLILKKMERFNSLSNKLSEEFHFIDCVEDDHREKYSCPPSTDLNKSLVMDAEMSDFAKAVAKKNEGFMPLSSFTPKTKKKTIVHETKIPNYGSLLAKDLKELCQLEEKVRNGEIPLTNDLKRKFAKACIYFSPNTSTSSESSFEFSGDNFMVEMSQETKDILDREFK